MALHLILIYGAEAAANTAANTFTSSGTYTVTVTDANGCTGTASQAVTVNTNPTDFN